MRRFATTIAGTPRLAAPATWSVSRGQRTMPQIALFIFGLAIAARAFGAEHPLQWTPQPIDAVDAALLQCADRLDDLWTVSMVEGELLAKPLSEDEFWNEYFAKIERTAQFSVGRYKDAPREIERVSNGFLVGYDGGEWGGVIVWFSPDLKHQYEISKHQVTHFVRRGNALYALEGLSHLGRSQGQLLKLSVAASGRWKASVVAKLPQAPYAFAPFDEDSILVVTDTQLLRVWFDGRIEQRYEIKTRLGPAYSAVRAADGTLYLGANSVVIRLIPTDVSYDEDWLLPPSLLSNCPCRKVRMEGPRNSKPREVVRCEK